MPNVTLQPVPETEKETFTAYFQDYLAELAAFTGARASRDGRYYYDLYDLYWLDPARMPLYILCDGKIAGLLLLRELPPEESPTAEKSFQVAEICVFRVVRRLGVGRAVMRLAAAMAQERRLPLTWSAYMNNGPAAALYASILSEFGATAGSWQTRRTRGIDRAGLARFYYEMTPPARTS